MSDPFIIQVPDVLRSKDPEFWEYLQRFLFELWQKTGGGGNAINDATVNSFSLSKIYGILGNNLKRPEFYSVSSAHTTAGNEVIEVTSTTAITANSNPDDGENITIYINGGAGSTFTDGSETDTFLVDGTVLSYAYHAEFNEWVRGC